MACLTGLTCWNALTPRAQLRKREIYVTVGRSSTTIFKSSDTSERHREMPEANPTRVKAMYEDGQVHIIQDGLGGIKIISMDPLQLAALTGDLLRQQAQAKV